MAAELGLGRLRLKIPLRLDRAQRASGSERVRGGHPDERALMHDRHARQRPGPRDIDRAEARAEGRRSQHPPVEHAGTGQVGGIALGARHDLRPGEARGRSSDQPFRRPRRHGRAGGGGLHAPHAAHELPVGGGAAAVGLPDAAVGCHELRGCGVPSGGGKAEQAFARGRGDLPQELAGIGHRAATERADVEGADVGVAHHEPDRRRAERAAPPRPSGTAQSGCPGRRRPCP